MARVACAVALLGGLALPVGAQPQEVGALARAQQKWGWEDLSSLQNQVQESVKAGTEQVKQQAESVKQRVKSKTDELTKGIASYRQSLADYGNALKDMSFRKAVLATGLCERLPAAEKESSGDIEKKMPSTMSQVDADPTQTEACEAVADEVTAENLKEKLKEGDTDETVNKFMKLVTQRSSAALCNGESGIKSWLQDNAHLRDTDPAAYKEKLKEQLKGKMSPIMDKYTSQLCGGEDDDERLFAVGSGPLAAVGSGGPAAAGVLAVFGVALFGLAALLVRRTVRQTQAQELERLAPEDAAEGGLVE